MSKTERVCCLEYFYVMVGKIKQYLSGTRYISLNAHYKIKMIKRFLKQFSYIQDWTTPSLSIFSGKACDAKNH